MPRTVSIAAPKKKKIRMNAARRREEAQRERELSLYGMTLEDVRMEPRPGRFFLCLIRAILIFMASFGMMGALVSSFKLSFSYPVVITGLFILSFLTAFLYYNKLTFYIGYFVVFGSFIAFSLSFYWYINSGYQAFMNEVFNSYSDYFRLLSTREASEFITDRYTTVTIAMLFMGWFFSILLNITISGYMNLPATFLLTFLPLQIAFYIDIVPPIPYLCMLLAVYISVAVLGRSGHFTLPYRRENDLDFTRRRKKKRHLHTYLASSRGMLQVAGYSIGLSVLFLLLAGGLFADDLDSRNVSNGVKNTTDRFVKSFVQGGFSALFDRYSAIGGLARGQLGGIGNVNPDYQTDLYLRLVPNNSGNIYLKAFSGVRYQDNCFFEDEAAELLNTKDYLPRLAASHDVQLEDLYEDHDYVSKIWIALTGADSGYLYRPYFPLLSSKETPLAAGGIPETKQQKVLAYYDSLPSFDNEEVMKSFGVDSLESYEVLYLPFEEQIAYDPNSDITVQYQELVYQSCLQIPEELKPSLEQAAKEAGLFEAAAAYPSLKDGENHPLNPDDEASLARYKELQSQRLGIAARLKRYFATEFSYTMSPGTTPRNEDVVDYFLHTQKRGYCAHFASSSALLLRYMGIPTRYVEGYMCTATDIMDGTPVSDDASGWQSNASELEKSGVVEVQLSDGSAHAWIEIWLDGYGWIPYEMTPPSDEEPMINLDLFSLFSGLFQNAPRNNSSGNGNNANAATGTGNLANIFGGLRFLLRPLAILLCALVLFLLFFPLYRRFTEFLKIKNSQKHGDYSEALLLSYRRFLRRLIRRRCPELKHPTLRDVFNEMEKEGVDGTPIPADELAPLHSGLSEAAYGRGELSAEDYQALRPVLSSLNRTLRPKKQKNKKR